ncbi:MAG TPA: hypothetical protein VK147_03725 [Candidatus Didemnitutus sp.]|nr:hypothetical protein [Candidatus Didemnitutus sp.]
MSQDQGANHAHNDEQQQTTTATPIHPGDFVHPARRPGHIAYALLVIDPAAIGQPYLVGKVYVRRAFPELSLPANFNVLSEAEQADVLTKLEAITMVDTSSVLPVEEKGLVFISEEFKDIYLRYTDPLSEMGGQEIEPARGEESPPRDQSSLQGHSARVEGMDTSGEPHENTPVGEVVP